MHISNFLHLKKAKKTIARYPLAIFVWLVCTAWIMPLSIASADPLPQQSELIDVQVSSNGAAYVDIHSYANSIVRIHLLEAYPNILPEECSQTGILPRNCQGTEFTTEVYHGYIQTDPEGKANLTISGQGYYHLALSLVKIPDEISDSLAPREFIKGFKTHVGLEATDSCARVPEVTFQKPLYQFGESIRFSLKPKYIQCEGQQEQNHTYSILNDERIAEYQTTTTGTPILLYNMRPDYPSPDYKFHFEVLDNSCNHGTSDSIYKYNFTNMTADPRLPVTKQEYKDNSAIPNHAHIYPRVFPMGKNNAFTVTYYQTLFANKLEVLNQYFGEAEVTIYLTDEFINLAKEIPDYHFEDIHVYICTKKCAELKFKRQNQNSLTYTVPDPYYDGTAGIYIYSGDNRITKDAIMVSVLPNYFKRFKIFLAIFMIIAAIVGTIKIKNRIYFNTILPPPPGPNDDLEQHIIQCVNAVYRELFNKAIEKTDEPAKILYQDAESKNIPNLKALEHYCMLIHTALKNDITQETIQTIRKETMNIIKKTKPKSK